jgi:hypothetical protein
MGTNMEETMKKPYTLTDHILAVGQDQKNFENAFQSVARMILESDIKK